MADLLGVFVELVFRSWGTAIGSFSRARRAATDARPCSWSTRLAAAGVLIEVTPLVIGAIWVAAVLILLSNDDLFLFLGLLLLLPLAAVAIAVAGALAAVALIGSAALLDGERIGRWGVVAGSLFMIAMGWQLLRADPAWLGWWTLLASAAEIALLLLPSTARDFARTR